jgi:aldose 1-epimerase
MSVRQEIFGRTRDGRDVTAYVLETRNRMTVEVLDYGAIVRTLCVPDTNGRLVDVALGYDDIASYEDDRSYLGAAIGRYANRISAGRFRLDGKTYQLATNDGPNHLHGGNRGFNKVVWRAQPFEDGETLGIALTHTSHDGDQGYPGNLDVEIKYTVSSSGAFSVEYRARADAPTPVNLTQHSYFNLAGEGAGDILGHEIMIDAKSFAEIDSKLIPTGKLLNVEGTPLDFRKARAIGARIEDVNEQLSRAGGYDHNYVLERPLAARVFTPASGIAMEVVTTEPGMQFYSGNFLNGLVGKKGHRYARRAGLCLETQHFPDSPNHPEFPSTILRPGNLFHSRTTYHFSAG